MKAELNSEVAKVSWESNAEVLSTLWEGGGGGEGEGDEEEERVQRDRMARRE